MTRYYQKTYRHVYGPPENRLTDYIRMGSEYQFVPCAPEIEPAPLSKPGVNGVSVSHARPIPGGFSGTLEVDLYATTPFLFGMKGPYGVTIPSKVNIDGEDKYVIPGKASRAMIKSIYRIATASALAPVNEKHRFGNRSIEYRKLRGFARERNESSPINLKRGWLIPQESIAKQGPERTAFKWCIFPEKPNDQTVDMNSKWLSGLLSREKERKEKNGEIIKITRDWRFETLEERRKDFIAYNGDEITKQLGPNNYLLISGPFKEKLKDAVFGEPNLDGDPIRIDGDLMDLVLEMNSTYLKEGAIFASGAKRSITGSFESYVVDYIKYLQSIGETDKARTVRQSLGLVNDEYQPLTASGYPGIPVYYFWKDEEEDEQDNNLFFGTAQVFKIPHIRDVASVAAERPKRQDSPEPVADWTATAFGDLAPWGVTGEPLASRIRFGFARHINKPNVFPPKPMRVHKVSQGQPKASFDMHYLYESEPDAENPNAGTWDSKKVYLAGHKRYPACRPFDPDFGVIIQQNKAVGKTESKVQPLFAQTAFRVKIKFHNLHPLELGALLWAVSFGDRRVFSKKGKTPYRHVGGRLRNKGLGRFRPENAALVDLVQNPMPKGMRLCDIEKEDHRIDALLLAFETEMGRRFKGQYPELNQKSDIEAFYSALPITTLLNVSNSAWQGEGEPDDMPDKIFAMPFNETQNRKATGGALFKPFMDLRKHLYTKQGVYATPLNTLLDAFFKPVQSPPEDRVTPCKTVFDSLLDPVSALVAWREAQEAVPRT